MLDLVSSSVLDAIYKMFLGNGGYKILDFSEIVSVIPKNLNVDENRVRDCISVLCEKDYILVKYQDENEVCLCLTVKCRTYFERQTDANIQFRDDRKRLLKYAFIGGLTGGAVTAIISAVVSLVTG